MRKVKLIVHETYQGKRKSEDVFVAVFLSNAAALTPNAHSSIIELTERSQDSLCSEKGATYGTRNEQTIYSAAVYCRLSKDDEQAGESVSIETQKMMLTDFCHERGFSIYEIYADDGYSGLNFNRPAFTRLLEDIDSGKINLVITKDLSRLGRDYIQTGYYTDVYFSRKGVRYIAVNDGIDTNRDDNDIAPFKNILNDMYAKDLSRKVKSAKRQRAYKGYYISAQAPYGYKVDPINRNRLIVDEEAAEVVKEIFRLALAGHSLSQISRILSEKKIITPGVYKA